MKKKKVLSRVSEFQGLLVGEVLGGHRIWVTCWNGVRRVWYTREWARRFVRGKVRSLYTGRSRPASY